MTGGEPAVRCQGPCGRIEGQGPDCHLSWSPAFGVWLCPDCRKSRTERELGATEAANAAAGRVP